MLKSCDTMVALPGATKENQTIFAKNSDRPATESQPLVQRVRETYPTGVSTKCQFVELPGVTTTYRHIGSRPYWCWGYEHGFNEHQVVIGNEGLASKYEFDSPKLIGMELIRLGLERAETAAEAISVMTELITKYGQANSAMIKGFAPMTTATLSLIRRKRISSKLPDMSGRLNRCKVRWELATSILLKTTGIAYHPTVWMKQLHKVGGRILQCGLISQKPTAVKQTARSEVVPCVEHVPALC